jgi:RNA polymerase sigma-70 factor (ECF subfamily)
VSYALAVPLAQLRVKAVPVDPDIALVERVRHGERRAFDQLVRHYQRPLYYLALRYLKNEADAADIAQKTFVRVFKSIGRFRGDSSFRTWIYRIAINLSLNHIRDNKREKASEIDEAALTTNAVGVDGIVGRQRSARLREAIEELPPKQRMVLELRIYDELPFREVGELADCSENAAKVNFHHAMRRLRSIMAGDER